jgi:3-phenylpropionate/trans-cinnamate dioxygenase ferredoxin reductase subunit
MDHAGMPSAGPMSDSALIVGAGQAAAQVAISLRQGGFRGPVVIIGAEPYLPYQRPPLSKKFLSSPQTPESLLLRPHGFWRDQDVALELGTAVGAVDRRRRCVTLTNGRELAYANLVFATGTSARALLIPGVDRRGVHSLRNIEDVRRLRIELDCARRVVIIGGGYIGLEVAAVMRGEGRDVTVLEAEERVLKRVTGDTISAFFDAFHRDKGVDIRLNVRAAGISGDERVRSVRTSQEEDLPADAVLIAAGARANDDLAAAAGIGCRDGILVDETARTDSADIYAVGDCTRFPSRRYGRRLRLESVQNAIDQAKVAAASILGRAEKYDPVPWFWSDQYDLKLQIAGLADDHDFQQTIGDVARPRFSVEYRKSGRLVAVDAVNDARAHMTARRRIAEETAAAEMAVGP